MTDLVDFELCDDVVELDVDVIEQFDNLHRLALHRHLLEVDDVAEKHRRILKQFWFHLFAMLHRLCHAPDEHC